MGKAIRLRGECQKNIVKLLDGLCGRYSRWEVWQDFIIMSAISIANVLGGPHREAREREYMEHASRYSSKELEVFAQMLAEVAMEMEREPDQDLLGELFMALGLSNEWKGQFFTPYSVCRAMSGMTYGDDLKARIEQRGWVAVNDPACGAGALLIAFANECRRPGNDINFQTSVLFVAQDIDFLAGMMCYIQLSLMGCPGYVVIDDSISHPITGIDPRGLIPRDGPNVWYTPMYFRDVWHWRRLWVQMDCLLFTAAPKGQAETPAPEETQPEEPQEEPEKTEEQLRQAGRQDHGLHFGVVEVGREVDRFLVDVGERRRGDLFEADFGVTHGGGIVAVDRAEVPLTVHERVAHREVLREAHDRHVGRRVAVRMVLTEHFPHDAGRLLVRIVVRILDLVHRVENAAMHGFQTVADIGQRAAHDHAHGVVEVGALHLRLERNGEQFPSDGVGGRRRLLGRFRRQPVIVVSDLIHSESLSECSEESRFLPSRPERIPLQRRGVPRQTVCSLYFGRFVQNAP